MLLQNEKYDYKYCDTTYSINENAIFANIIKEDESRYFIERAIEYGRFKIKEEWILKSDFKERYKSVEDAKKWILRGNRFGSKVYLGENGLTQNLPESKLFATKNIAMEIAKTLAFGDHWVAIPCGF